MSDNKKQSTAIGCLIYIALAALFFNEVQSVVRALDEQGLMKDNGESRSKKAYLITEKGKGM